MGELIDYLYFLIENCDSDSILHFEVDYSNGDFEIDGFYKKTEEISR